MIPPAEDLDSTPPGGSVLVGIATAALDTKPTVVGDLIVVQSAWVS